MTKGSFCVHTFHKGPWQKKDALNMRTDCQSCFCLRSICYHGDQVRFLLICSTLFHYSDLSTLNHQLVPVKPLQGNVRQSAPGNFSERVRSFCPARSAGHMVAKTGANWFIREEALHIQNKSFIALYFASSHEEIVVARFHVAQWFLTFPATQHFPRSYIITLVRHSHAALPAWLNFTYLYTHSQVMTLPTKLAFTVTRCFLTLYWCPLTASKIRRPPSTLWPSTLLTSLTSKPAGKGSFAR